MESYTANNLRGIPDRCLRGEDFKISHIRFLYDSSGTFETKEIA